jgi:anti-anti-sigma factor
VDAPIHTTSVQAVATTPQAAVAVSKLLVNAQAQMRHAGKSATVLLDRAKTGAPGALVTGPYFYVFNAGGTIAHFAFPARLDQEIGERLEQTLAGLDATRTQGLLLDCVHLTYINSKGLGALAGSSSRLNLHLFRVPEPIKKVFAMTGLDHLIALHEDLTSAVMALVAAHLAKTQHSA